MKYIRHILCIMCVYITPASADIPLSYSDDEPPLPFYDKPYSPKPTPKKSKVARQALPSMKQAELSPDIRDRAEDLAVRIFGDDFRHQSATNKENNVHADTRQLLPQPAQFAVPARGRKIVPIAVSEEKDNDVAIRDSFTKEVHLKHVQNEDDQRGTLLQARTDNKGRGAYLDSQELQAFLREGLDEKIKTPYLLSASGISDNRGYFVRLPSVSIHAEREYVAMNEDRGRFEIAVMFRAEGAFERVVFRGRAEAAEYVLVPAETIAAHTLITANMLKQKLVSGKAAETMLQDPAHIIGKSAARLLRPDRPLRPRDVKSPTLIKRNAVIDIEYSAPGIFLRTTAKASQDGAAGDVIRARNITGDKVIYAQVTGVNTARAVEQGTN